MDEQTEPSGAANEAAGPEGQPPTPSVTPEVPSAPSYPPGYGPGPFPPGYGPPPGYGWMPPPPGWARPAAGSGGWLGRLFRSLVLAWTVAGILALTVAGLAVWLGTSGPSRQVPAFGPLARPGTGAPFGGRAGGGFFGATGVIGTVASVSGGSFTVNARSGATVTVNEQSSTTYYNGTTAATSTIVTSGANVLVQGSRSGDTVTAARVVVVPAGGFFPGGP